MKEVHSTMQAASWSPKMVCYDCMGSIQSTEPWSPADD